MYPELVCPIKLVFHSHYNLYYCRSFPAVLPASILDAPPPKSSLKRSTRMILLKYKSGMALLQWLPISHRRKKRQSPQQPVWSHRTWPLVCLEPHCPSAACRTLPQPHWPPAGLCRHWVGPSEGQRLLLWTALSSYLKVSLPHLFHISVRYRPIGEAFPDHSTENHNPLHPFLSFFSTALLPPDIHFYFCLYCLSPRLDSKLHKDREQSSE